MTEIALGWCETDRAPEGISAHSHAGITLLSVLATRPEQVLAQQQRCFDLGLDLLPLSPARLCPRAEAEAQMTSPALRQKMQTLQGKAQISIHLQWDEAETPIRSGRDFLASRRARSIAADLARAWLEDLARAALLPASPVELRRFGAVIHLLAPRQALPSPETLSPIAGPMPLQGASLTLTGPWPPFAFAALP